MTKCPKKKRLDVHLLTKGLVESRQQAQRLILAGKVRDVTGKIFDKPGQQVAEDIDFFQFSSFLLYWLSLSQNLEETHGEVDPTTL